MGTLIAPHGQQHRKVSAPVHLSELEKANGGRVRLISREYDRSETGKSDSACCRGRQVNHAAAHKRSPVLNSNHDTATIFLVGDTHSRAERERTMSGCQSRWIHPFPARGLSSGIAIAITIDGCHSRLCLSTPCEGNTYCKCYCKRSHLHSKHPGVVGEGGALPSECGLDVAREVLEVLSAGIRQSCLL